MLNQTTMSSKAILSRALRSNCTSFFSFCFLFNERVVISNRRGASSYDFPYKLDRAQLLTLSERVSDVWSLNTTIPKLASLWARCVVDRPLTRKHLLLLYRWPLWPMRNRRRSDIGIQAPFSTVCGWWFPRRDDLFAASRDQGCRF